jgi:hypothetical protein
MFCPQCAAENDLEMKYCRRCGLLLSAARISLQGGVDQALTKHTKGEILLTSGSVTLVIFVLTAIANMFLNPLPWNYFVLVNLLLGLVIGVPMMTAGVVQLRRARRTLQRKDEQGDLTDNEPHEISSSSYSTDRLLSPMNSPGSVTEQTTLDLKSCSQEHL